MWQRSSKLTLAVAVLALLASACRGGGTTVEAPTDGEGDGGTAEIATGEGVSDEACPDTANDDNGCIYLGIITDLTGPIASLGTAITESQEKFWQRVNESGGIGGFDIDATTHVADHQFNPQTASEVYQEMKGDILALANSFGSAPTGAIIDDMTASDIVATGAAWSSRWYFEDNILNVGANQCYSGMNMVDFAVNELGAESVMSVHYPGESGDDTAGGARIAAEFHEIPFTGVPTDPGPSNQGAAIDAVVDEDPDLVVLTMSSIDVTEIVGQTTARGYDGNFIGVNGTWDEGMLESAAAEAIEESYFVSDVYPPFDADTPGHEAMRAALGDVDPSVGHVYGWIWSYPLKAALEKAVEQGDLTRQGVFEAATGLESVDYEGMLPPEAGDVGQMFRESNILRPDPDAETGLSVVQELFASPVASETTIERPCPEL